MYVSNRKGLSFTELVVATTLMGIVLTGVVSFSFMVKGIQDSTNKSTILSMRTSAFMSHIVKDAAAAVGDPTDMGVLVYEDYIAPEHATICFRHDIPVTPDDYSDDIWVCYSHGHSYNIYRHYNVNATKVPCTSWANCTAAPSVTAAHHLHIVGDPYFQIVNDASGRMEYIEIILLTRWDASQAAHPLDNPECTMVTRVSPAGHAR